jgi:hypothetical protein
MPASVPYPPVDGTEPCRDDPDMFFPESSSNVASKLAKELCADCDIRQACLAYALAHNVQGVWGGTTSKDREKLRRGGTPPERKRPVDRELVLRSLDRRMPVHAVASLAGTTSRHVMRIRAEADPGVAS